MAAGRSAFRPRMGAVMSVAAAVALCSYWSGTRGRLGDGGEEAQEPVAGRLVDVNVASVEELALLPGIGPRIAGRIASDRAERGPFASVDELRRVKGIGAATIDRVRPFATAGQPT